MRKLASFWSGYPPNTLSTWEIVTFSIVPTTAIAAELILLIAGFIWLAVQ